MSKGVGPGALVGDGATEADRDIAGRRPRSDSTSPGATPALILRPYQIECIDALRRAYLAGHRAPVLQVATGGGKTVIFADVARRVVAKGHRALILVHRRELIRQTSEKLTRAGVSHGIIAAGFRVNPQQLVQVASVQTAARRLESLNDVDLVIIDEAHHARAEVWQLVLDKQPQARLLGVTATPVRLDGKGLGVEAVASLMRL